MKVGVNKCSLGRGDPCAGADTEQEELVSSEVEQKAKHDDQRHQALEIDGMHGEGGCSYQSARGRRPALAALGLGDGGARCSGSGTTALDLGLGDGSARPQAWGRWRSASGTVALGLGLGEPGGATVSSSN
jgi:hypothetical protein